MALVVDTTKRYRNVPNDQNFTFSLSKPLNQLTPADLQTADFWVGFTCCSINQIYEGKGGEGIPENNPNYCNLWGTDPDWWYDQTNWASVHWSFPANQPNGVYMRNVYVNRELNPGDYTVANSTVRIVLEITPDENTTIQKLCMLDNSNYLQAEYDTSSYDSQMADYSYISPAVLLVVNNCVYLINQNIQRFFVPDNIGFYINSTTDQGYQSSFPSFENLSYHKLAMGWTMGYTTGSIVDNCVKTGTGSAPIYTYNDVDFNGHTGILTLSGGGSNYHIRIGCSMSANADDSDFSLIHRAYSGVRFRVNGTWYKPIISGGIVTGYSDDMTVASEWDNWTKASGHNVPSGGGGGGGGDDMDEMKLGATGSSGGFTKFYIMSPADLVTFLNDFYATADEGESLSNNIVCSYILGVPSTEWTGRDSVEVVPIVIHNSAQGTPFVSTDSYNHILATNNDIPVGSFDVPRMTNTFYDFSPYSTYELFIPGCGWISLPDTVAGRKIYVYLEIDIATCGAKGIVKFDDGAVCAVCGGVLGSSIPLQIIESGLLRGANVQAGATALGGALMAGAGFGGENIGVGLSGISNVINGFLQSYVAGNTNFTNQKGSSGDITQFAMGHKTYLKITYPPIDEVVNNPMFGHSVGYLCETVGEIKDFEGFTICSNPHVAGFSCTSEEKAEIERLLSNGIIVHMHKE